MFLTAYPNLSTQTIAAGCLAPTNVIFTEDSFLPVTIFGLGARLDDYLAGKNYML